MLYTVGGLRRYRKTETESAKNCGVEVLDYRDLSCPNLQGVPAAETRKRGKVTVVWGVAAALPESFTGLNHTYDESIGELPMQAINSAPLSLM